MASIFRNLILASLVTVGISTAAQAELFLGIDFAATTPHHPLLTKLTPGPQAGLSLGYTDRDTHGFRLALSYRQHQTLKLEGTAAESMEGKLTQAQAFFMYEYLFWKTQGNNGLKFFFLSLGPGLISWQAEAKNLESGEEKQSDGTANASSLKIGRKSDSQQGIDSAYYLVSYYSSGSLEGASVGLGYEWMF